MNLKIISIGEIYLRWRCPAGVKDDGAVLIENEYRAKPLRGGGPVKQRLLPQRRLQSHDLRIMKAVDNRLQREIEGVYFARNILINKCF